MSVFLEVGKNSIGQLQVSIQDDSGGYRIAGGKYDGGGSTLMTHPLSQRDATELRLYLDRYFPVAAQENDG